MADTTQEPTPEILSEAPSQWISEDVGKRGVGLVKVIDEGQGSSANYSKEVLQRDAPKAFPAGTHMHLDHPSDEHRGARAMATYAGVLMEDANWRDDGPAGPGVYAEAKVFPDVKDFLNARAEHGLGVSIRAPIRLDKEGNATEILHSPISSVDFVTVPGRGGTVVQAFEAYREESAQEKVSPQTKPANQGENTAMPEAKQEAAVTISAEEAAEIRANQARLQAENLELKARQVARDIIDAAESKPSGKIAAKAIEYAVRNPPTDDAGNLDRGALKTALEAEIADLTAIAGEGKAAGKPDGDPPVEQKAEESREETLLQLVQGGRK